MKFTVRIRYFDFPNLKYVDEQIVLFNSFRVASLFATEYNNSGYDPLAYVALHWAASFSPMLTWLCLLASYNFFQ